MHCLCVCVFVFVLRVENDCWRQQPAYLTILALHAGISHNSCPTIKIADKFGQEHTNRRSHFTPLIDVISLLRNFPVLFDVLGEDEREDRKERTTIGK